MSALNRTIDPDIEPVSYSETKLFLRLDFDDDKTLVNALIKSCRIKLENMTGRAFITQTWKLTKDNFNGGNNRSKWWDGVRSGIISDLVTTKDSISLPIGRVQSITSFNAYSFGGVIESFAPSNYFVDTESEPGRVVLNSGAVWPVGLRDKNAMEITFVAGYGDNRTDVPDDIRTAIKIFVAEIYEKRCSGAVVPEVVKNIIEQYKIIKLG